MLRDTYPDSKRYRIIVYALLPETYPNPNWDTGNYHANGFAALLELNALSVNRFSPYDLLGLKGRLKIGDPFNGCYLFTNENENGLTVDVDKQIPRIIADFLYQKIVATQRSVGPRSGGGRMRKTVTGHRSTRQAVITRSVASDSSLSESSDWRSPSRRSANTLRTILRAKLRFSYASMPGRIRADFWMKPATRISMSSFTKRKIFSGGGLAMTTLHSRSASSRGRQQQEMETHQQ